MCIAGYFLKFSFKLAGQGGLSKKTIGGQTDRRYKGIQRNTSESGIKCVCLNPRSITNKKKRIKHYVRLYKTPYNRNN